MSLEKLSVLERAAKAYATGEESSTQELSEQKIGRASCRERV